MKRRDFIITGGLAGLGISMLPTSAFSRPQAVQIDSLLSATGPFELPALGYGYDALEPYIDAQTMEIHYSKHHAGYVNKLNAALENHPLNGKNLEEILATVTPDETDTAVLNNAGGHFNHSLFWKIMQPGGKQMPTGALASALEKKFGSLDAFLNSFSAAAGSVFGSGWAWLSIDENKELFVSSSRNQENPLMRQVVTQQGTPILGIDVWEHAYYLKFQNRRKDYINNFIQVINWSTVGKLYETAL